MYEDIKPILDQLEEVSFIDKYIEKYRYQEHYIIVRINDNRNHGLRGNPYETARKVSKKAKELGYSVVDNMCYGAIEIHDTTLLDDILNG